MLGYTTKTSTHKMYCSVLTNTQVEFLLLMINSLFFSIQDFSMAKLSSFNCLFLLRCFLVLSANENYLLITTNSGQIQGKVISVLDGEVRAFLGIPYGRPPVGNLRFRAPEPADPWQGVKNAINYANSCVQIPYTTFPGRIITSVDIQHNSTNPSLILLNFKYYI